MFSFKVSEESVHQSEDVALGFFRELLYLHHFREESFVKELVCGTGQIIQGYIQSISELSGHFHGGCNLVAFIASDNSAGGSNSFSQVLSA